MPRLPGLFDSFDNLDQISPEAIAAWLKPAPELALLENYLANKIFYPQALPVTERDMRIDLSILREAIKQSKALADETAVSKPAPQKTNSLPGSNPFINIDKALDQLVFLLYQF